MTDAPFAAVDGYAAYELLSKYWANSLLPPGRTKITDSVRTLPLGSLTRSPGLTRGGWRS